MLYLLCRSWAVVVDASARRFLGSWSGIDHFWRHFVWAWHAWQRTERRASPPHIRQLLL